MAQQSSKCDLWHRSLSSEGKPNDCLKIGLKL